MEKPCSQKNNKINKYIKKTFFVCKFFTIWKPVKLPEDTAHQMPVPLSGMFIQTKPDNFFHHLATGGVIPGSMCCQVSANGYEYFQRSFIP